MIVHRHVVLPERIDLNKEANQCTKLRKMMYGIIQSPDAQCSEATIMD
jgi:hypothetical protein